MENVSRGDRERDRRRTRGRGRLVVSPYLDDDTG
jgi:hypothetical protein